MATALAVAMLRMHAIHTAADWAVQQLGYSSVKRKLLRVAVEGRDVFAVTSNLVWHQTHSIQGRVWANGCTLAVVQEFNLVPTVDVLLRM